MKPLAIWLLLACTVSTAPAITLLQVDTFDNGTDGWEEGAPSPNPPVMVSGGGPDGSNHLQNISDAAGMGGRLLMWNESQWTGDYLVAGVTAISLFADNRSDDAQINLRLAFNGPGGWFITESMDLMEGSGWTELSYGLDSADLTHVTGGSGEFADTMGAVTMMEILSESGLPFTIGGGNVIRGDEIEADLRIDQIAAVPEPGSCVLLALAASALFRRRRHL